MADKDAVDRRAQRLKKTLMGELIGSVVLHGTSLDETDAEIVVEALGPVIRQLLEELDEYGDALASLRSKLNQARRDIELERQRADSRVADEMSTIARLQTTIAERRASQLRAELEIAEVNEALRKAGFGYPIGARGVRDAMGFLERHKDRADARIDFLSRLADVVLPDEDIDAPLDDKARKLRLEQVTQIIKEHEADERAH